MGKYIFFNNKDPLSSFKEKTDDVPNLNSKEFKKRPLDYNTLNTDRNTLKAIKNTSVLFFGGNNYINVSEKPFSMYNDGFSPNTISDDCCGVAPHKKTLQRIGQACVECRKKKTKCSGEYPECSSCVKKGNKCFYPEKKKRGRPRKDSNRKFKNFKSDGFMVDEKNGVMDFNKHNTYPFSVSLNRNIHNQFMNPKNKFLRVIENDSTNVFFDPPYDPTNESIVGLKNKISPDKTNPGLQFPQMNFLKTQKDDSDKYKQSKCPNIFLDTQFKNNEITDILKMERDKFSTTSDSDRKNKTNDIEYTRKPQFQDGLANLNFFSSNHLKLPDERAYSFSNPHDIYFQSNFFSNEYDLMESKKELSNNIESSKKDYRLFEGN
ncbi:putative transcriptional regulatory protein [Smittium mucronatum]|uniref:Putative transcriptional regulatory protein n=1 Tax=Smittium mucronatum TaxID=133383 RepID=A0A1R0H7G4_9FUNG|nr:putative transcriptional regulatory protein [Smittium mucronatum]